MVGFKNRSIVSTDDFSREDLEYIIRKAQDMRKLEMNAKRYSLTQALVNKVLANLFYESSTRTRTSFERAMKELGGDVMGFAGPEGTSVMKRESLYMTLKMFEAYHADAIVMRHSKDGSARWAADSADIPIINGGDGTNEHPTQTLLDLCTMSEILDGNLDNYHIGFGGDNKYGRTVHSLPLGLSKFDNITLHLAAPEPLSMSQEMIDLLTERGMKVIKHDSLDEALKLSQIFYMTRPQFERMERKLPEEEQQAILGKFRISLKSTTSYFDIRFMHPLPIDSKVQEIEFPVVFSKNQYFLPQAQWGLFLKKALLYDMLSGEEYSIFNEHPDRSLMEPSNIIQRKIKEPKNPEKLYVDKIENGTIIDHISLGKGDEIRDLFYKTGYPTTAAYGMPPNNPKKDIVKIFGFPLNQRIIKQILMKSSDVTFNIIKDGKVVEKYKAILCNNENCITRVINEDVPPKFYRTNDERVECHYCKHTRPLDLTLRAEEINHYLKEEINLRKPLL